MTRQGKLIPKENLFHVIQLLSSNKDSTWTNIYNMTVSEKGQRYATTDIGYSVEYYLNEKMIIAKPKNRQTDYYVLTDLADDQYDDFLKKIAETKKWNLEKYTANLKQKKIYNDDKILLEENKEDFNKFIETLEDISKFYTNLLHTRENSDYDGDSMTGLADIQSHQNFNASITYIIKLMRKTIEECCRQLKYGKDQDQRTMINETLENITWFLKV